MPFHPAIGPVLSPAITLPHLFEHLRDEHWGISISADSWIFVFPHLSGPIWVLFYVWLFKSYLQLVIGNSCHTPIIHCVLYCLDYCKFGVYSAPWSEVVTNVSSVRRMSQTSVLICSDFYARKCLLVLLGLGFICCVEWTAPAQWTVLAQIPEGPVRKARSQRRAEFLCFLLEQKGEG